MNKTTLRKKRLLWAVALAAALCAHLAAPFTSYADNPSPEIGWDGNRNIPAYNLSAPGLPAVFAAHSKNVNLYHTVDAAKDAVYCIDRSVDVADSQFVESADSKRPLTADQKEWLAYILSNGAKKYESGNLALNKFQAATQLAVWMVTERDGDGQSDPFIYLNESRWDKYLYKADGDVTQGDAFAPTPEIGRMARKLLENAKNKEPRNFPSFLTDVKDPPKEFYTDSSDSTKEREFHIEDLNKVLRLEMGDGTLKLKDDKGLSVFVKPDADILDIYGFQSQEETLVFDYSLGGDIVYLEPSNKTSAQKMARYIRNNSNSGQLHVKLLKKPATIPPGGSTPPGITSPPGVTPPGTTTPPGISTPPAVTPPGNITPPAISTPPGVTSPPVITPPPGTTRPPSTPPPGAGVVPPPPTTEAPPSPPKTETPPDPPKPPASTENPPPPPLYTVDDGKAPSGTQTAGGGDKVGLVTPSGKLPKTGAVLDQQPTDGETAGDGLPAGEAGAASLAAVGIGMALYLNRKRNRG